MSVREAIFRSIVLLGLGAGTVALCMKFPNAAHDPAAGMVLLLPERVEGFHVMEMEVTEEEKKWLPPDTGIM